MRTSAEHANMRASSDQVKCSYARSEASSVDPPSLQAPSSPSCDSLQDLIARIRETKKMRTRYHLTETDCNLMCQNSTDLTFASGSVIVKEGQIITQVYRIKKGVVSLTKGGTKLYELTPGHFIGESLFIRGEAKDKIGASLIANGQVVVSQLNLTYLKQLIDVDKVLAFKIYRHIASKLSALTLSVVTQVAVDATSPNSAVGSPRGALPVDVSMIRLDSELMTGVTGNEPKMPEPDMPFAIATDSQENRKRNRKSMRPSKTKSKAFKRYTLENSARLKLNDTQITIKGSSFKTNRRIKYNKILDVSKTGPKSVTIIYNVQAKTVTFKTEEEMNEFYGIIRFFASNSNGKKSKQFSANVPLFFDPDSPYASSTPISSIPPAISLSPRELASSPTSRNLSSSNPLSALSPTKEANQAAADRVELMQLAVRQDLKKGDLVIAEGDLFQRIYTVVSGSLQLKRGGRVITEMEEGDVFGGNEEDIKKFSNEAPFDFIVACDCIYYPDLIPIFLETINRLSSPSTAVIIGGEKHYVKVLEVFLSQAQKMFNVEEKSLDSMDDSYKGSDFFIWHLSKKMESTM